MHPILTRTILVSGILAGLALPGAQAGGDRPAGPPPNGAGGACPPGPKPPEGGRECPKPKEEWRERKKEFCKERVEQFLVTHPGCRERWKRLNAEQRQRILKRVMERQRKHGEKLKGMSAEDRKEFFRNRCQERQERRKRLYERVSAMSPEDREAWKRKHGAACGWWNEHKEQRHEKKHEKR